MCLKQNEWGWPIIYGPNEIINQASKGLPKSNKNCPKINQTPRPKRKNKRSSENFGPKQMSSARKEMIWVGKKMGP